jgi:uncharacterized protein (TIGR02599 family)
MTHARHPFRATPGHQQSGFTILEVLVASTVLMLMLGVVLSTISQTSTVTRRATDKISAFQSARNAFDLITAKLSQATLNSYWAYDIPAAPTKYIRKSELHFLIGQAGISPFGGTAGTGQAIYFQAPGGGTENVPTFGSLGALLNACGYFISYENEDSLPSPFPAPQSKYRYRLMQAIQPTGNFQVYGSTTGNAWVTGVVGVSPQNYAVPIAENIVYLAAWPRKAPADDPQGSSLTTAYSYDSRLGASSSPQPETANQMPPVVQITIVAIDEASAARICKDATPPTEITSALSGLFSASNQDQFKKDIGDLEKSLGAAHINFRIFTAMVPIRESKMQ